jgi:hypothetical protein
MKQPLHPNDFADQLEDPERHFPGNFETEGKAVAALLCLCQDAATEIRRMQQGIETLHAMYEQVCKQRDEVMAQQMMFVDTLSRAKKANERASEVIFKACVNLKHWKRTAMRYLKRNSPELFERAVNEFNEHPEGRGKRFKECPHGMVDTCCGNPQNCHNGDNK